jgi:hypothetical membrane protein
MRYSNSKAAGILFFIAATQFFLGLLVAEALYPGYNISTNYISDLGIGPSAMVFNVSVFLLGLLLILGTYFLHRSLNVKILTILFVLTAIGAMGVGIFIETNQPMHTIVSLLAFLFGGLTAVYSYKLMKLPVSLINVILGMISLSALVLLITQQFLGLGPGGMERMVLYPILIWIIGYSGYLLTLLEKS